MWFICVSCSSSARNSGIGRPFIYAYSTYGQQGDRDLDQSECR